MRFATFKQNVFYVYLIFRSSSRRHFHCKIIYLSIVNEEEHIDIEHVSNFTDLTCNCDFNQWLICFTRLIFGTVWLKSIQEFKCERHKSVSFVKRCICFSQHISTKQNAMKLNTQPSAPLFLQIIYWVTLGLFKDAFQCCTIVSWNGNLTL